MQAYDVQYGLGEATDTDSLGDEGSGEEGCEWRRPARRRVRGGEKRRNTSSEEKSRGANKTLA